MRGLNQKVVVILGGATGIGAATARRLSEEGARVVVGDINQVGLEKTVGLIKAKGGEAIAVECNIANDTSVKALINKAISAYGNLDLLHVNAADMRLAEREPNILDTDMEVFDLTIRVNLRGHVVCTRYALPHMLAQGRGAIVYTSSEAAFGYAHTTPFYAMAKAGLNALARHVAARYGRQGIRANAVCPGCTITEEVRGNQSKELLAELMAPILGPRLGESDDSAAMIAMLLSDDAAYVNGQSISVNGGSLLR